MVVNPPAGVSVMVVAAHPDDLEGGCGGTLARAMDAGASVWIMLVTSGDKGSADPQADVHALARRRERKATDAANLLGAEEIIFLRHPDGEVEADRALCGEIARWIRTWKPEVIFTFDPEHPLPRYVSHRDHRITGRMTLDAVYPAARDPLNFREQIDEGLSIHNVRQVWLFASELADRYVDITLGLDRKIAARLAHASLTPSPAALPESWRRRAAETGAIVGLDAGEAFTIIELG
ncbi:MAG: PIG-L deacetylase family protein [Thermomicrobiales bacterium]